MLLGSLETGKTTLLNQMRLEGQISKKTLQSEVFKFFKFYFKTINASY